MPPKGDVSATGVRKTIKMRPINIKEGEANETVSPDLQHKRASRDSAIALIHSTNTVPFKFNGSFICFYCPSRFANMPELTQHVGLEHKHVTEDDIRKTILTTATYQPIKVNVLDFGCKLCNDDIHNFEDLKHHLIGKHQTKIELGNEGVIPYKIMKDEYICVLCEKKFEQYRILNKHINEHYIKYKCNQCGAGFAMPLLLWGHAASHEEGQYPCDKCSKVFNNITSQQQHICNVHLGRSRYKCHHCEETFQDRSQIQKHLQTAHDIKLRQNEGDTIGMRKTAKVRPIKEEKTEDSKLVPDKKKKRASRDSAIALIHSANIFPFKFNGSYICFYCPSRFVNMPELAQHIEIKHNKITEDEIKKASGKDNLNISLKVNVLDYGCKLCNEEISSFEDLKHHLISTHKKKIDFANDGVLPYKITKDEFICVICEKKLKQYGILNKHINEHYAKYNCEQCGAGFATPLRLRGHVLWHEEGNYPCDKCSKVFNNASSKQQHIQRVHLQSTRYRCHHCGETFREYNQKQKHLLTTHGIALYKGKAIARSVHNTVNMKKALKTDLKQKKKDNGRDSAIVLILSTKVFPFKFHGMFLCIYCPSRFINMPELVEHVKLEHKDITEYDLRKATARDSLNLPMKINVLEYGCKLCDDEISNFGDLKHHLIDKHKKPIDLANDGVWPYRITEKEFICVLCGLQLEDYRLLTKHLNEHYRKFICDQCGVGFASELRFRSHAITHEMGSHPCNECGKVFTNHLAKQQHLEKVHIKKKNVKCTRCAETFLDYYQRGKHLRSAHGAKAKEYKCSFCPKIFYRNSNVRAHERRRHMLTTKKYTCDICNYKALSKHRMAEHLVCHTGEKNFECQVCKKKYSTKKCLSEHMKIHNNDRQFVCHYCDRAFIQKVSLKGHMKTHHKEFILA